MSERIGLYFMYAGFVMCAGGVPLSIALINRNDSFLAIPIIGMVCVAIGMFLSESGSQVSSDSTSVPPILPSTYIPLVHSADENSRPDYAIYLQSPLWKERARQARERAGQRCQLCNGYGPLEVHHRTYERLGHEHPDDLTVLCRSCHSTFHQNQKSARH